jgi:hypothetical protein
MSRLYKVSFRAHLIPEGFACPATVVTLADTSAEAIELASRWFRRNLPYYESTPGFPTACLDSFEAIELACFFCYGIKRPLMWEFPQ